MTDLWRVWFYEEPNAEKPILKPWAQRAIFAVPIGVFITFGTLALVFNSLFLSQDTIDLQEGDVARQDIIAPSSLTYNSAVLTEQARQQAIESVESVYVPDPNKTRQQIRLSSDVVAYIEQIRGDHYASQALLIEDLNHIDALTVSENIWTAVLELTDARWEVIGNQITTLVERTMQGDIREDNVVLLRNNLVNTVAGQFSDSESSMVVAIAADLIQPNTFYDEDATQVQQEAEAAAVPAQSKTYEAEQTIVRSGTIVTPLDMEALEEYGLLQPSNTGLEEVIGGLLAMTLVTLILWLYVERFYPNIRHNPRMFILIAVLFLLFLFSVHIFGENGVNQPYLYPASALALLLTSLVGAEMAIMAVSLLAVLVGTTQTGALGFELAVITVISGIAGVLSLRRVDKLNSFFVAGLLIGLANILIMLVFAFHVEDTPSLAVLISRSLVAFTSGLFAAGVSLVALYVITSLLNLTTNLKIIELMDSKQPLLQRLLRESPGTYQHSLQVGNLSELAAEAINANASLIRVAAMYHDIGKMLNPYYFSENTTAGMNPHGDLNDPYKSAKVIIGHVIEGERLAKRHNLPQRIRDFILEHHGTTQVLYFYNTALEQADETGETVDISEFTYPGPAPRSRETAIMMLADGCESATRAKRPSTKDDIEEVVNTIFELRLGEGQLDDSGLTLNDLKTVRNIFIETLQAMYHPRIAYKMRPKEDDKKPQLSSGIVKHLEANRDDTEKKSDPKKPKLESGEQVKIRVTGEQPSPTTPKNKPENAAIEIERVLEEKPVLNTQEINEYVDKKLKESVEEKPKTNE